MFTGIVQVMGRVASLDAVAAGARLVIDRRGWNPPQRPVAEGDSICISGVCLTVVACDEKTLAFDVIPETLRRTTLGSLQAGRDVNIEPSLTAQTPMSGHFVQGHVEGVGIVTHADHGREVRLRIEPPNDLAACIIAKGSITLDGISMTIAEVRATDFEVALIPETIERTTLGAAERGSRLNLETDIVSRTVVQTLERMTNRGEGVTLDTLRCAGFVGQDAL